MPPRMRQRRVTPPAGGVRRESGGGAAHSLRHAVDKKEEAPRRKGASKESFVVQDHAGAFVDIAAAKGKDEIAGFGMLVDVICHGLEGGQADTAGDLFAEVFRGDVVGIDLPAAHNR